MSCQMMADTLLDMNDQQRKSWCILGHRRDNDSGGRGFMLGKDPAGSAASTDS